MTLLRLLTGKKVQNVEKNNRCRSCLCELSQPNNADEGPASILPAFECICCPFCNLCLPPLASLPTLMAKQTPQELPWEPFQPKLVPDSSTPELHIAKSPALQTCPHALPPQPKLRSMSSSPRAWAGRLAKSCHVHAGARSCVPVLKSLCACVFFVRV